MQIDGFDSIFLILTPIGKAIAMCVYFDLLSVQTKETDWHFRNVKA